MSVSINRWQKICAMLNGWWNLRHGKKLTLMVGFNRRFAPLYGELKTQLATAASLRMDKHRSNSVGPHDLYFTLLDDYLHVVDTALWLSGGKASLDGGTLLTNDAGEMLFAEHHFFGRSFADHHLYASPCRKPA